MRVDMIKPFKILSVRPEEGGAQTVFFSVSKTESVEPNKMVKQTMETAAYVPADEDVDQYIFDMLQKGGWI